MVLGGPYFLPWLVRRDRVFCRGRSGGPDLGGTNYRMTQTTCKDLTTHTLTFLFHEPSSHVFSCLYFKTDYVSIGATPYMAAGSTTAQSTTLSKGTLATPAPTMAASHHTLFSTTDTLCLLVSTLVATQHRLSPLTNYMYLRWSTV